mgnify:CR=1 FL=1
MRNKGAAGVDGCSIDEVEARHAATRAAIAEVGSAIPIDWRRGSVERSDLSRFLFGPEDIIVIVGQDGLVANAAKYLDGQPVIGVNTDTTPLQRYCLREPLRSPIVVMDGDGEDQPVR